MGAAAPGRFAHDRVFAADCLDIVDGPITSGIMAHPFKPIAHPMVSDISPNV
jgi:hypothetical protein